MGIAAKKCEGYLEFLKFLNFVKCRQWVNSIPFHYTSLRPQTIQNKTEINQTKKPSEPIMEQKALFM